MGGALQAAVSFIFEVIRNDGAGGIDWCFVLSGQVDTEASKLSVSLMESRVKVLEQSPAKSKESRKELLVCESEWQPDVVFTFFGPAYVEFRAPHLCGVADGWVTHSNRLAFKSLGGKNILIILPHLSYKAYWFRKADRWVVEAENAKIGMVHRLRIQPDSICVVPNSCGRQYLTEERHVSSLPAGSRVKILCLSSYYPHKNLEIIPHVAKQIQEIAPALDFEFIITLPPDRADLKKILSLANAIGVVGRINNVGPVPVANGPAIYKHCHISFLPSLLETFSANYPEAMAMACPIVTTDLPFARDVCGEAALYYEPEDAGSAAELIVRLLREPATWTRLVAEGKRVLRKLPTPHDKYVGYVACLNDLAKHVETLVTAAR